MILVASERIEDGRGEGQTTVTSFRKQTGRQGQWSHELCIFRQELVLPWDGSLALGQELIWLLVLFQSWGRLRLFDSSSVLFFLIAARESR